MASNKRTPINSPIPDLATPWDNGESAYTGKMIESFIKTQIADIIASKFGDAKYEDGGIAFYDADGGSRLGFVDLTSGVSYSINAGIDRSTNFYVLMSDPRTPITITPSTQEMTFGSTEKTDYDEDYTFQVFVDDGSGYANRTPQTNTIKGGESATIDVRTWLKSGANKVRIIVNGESSGQVKTVVLTVTLTSLNLTCNHSWHKAWIQGEDYFINNIYFGGNLAKTLHVRIGDVDYTQPFSAAAQYTSIPYEFNVTDKFPALGTGVHEVEVWMEGGDVRTTTYKFRVMCIAASDVQTAKLVCINSLPERAVNYSTQTLFEYATYNLTSVNLDINANDNGTITTLVSNQTLTQQTQTKQPYMTSIQLSTEMLTGLSLDITLSAEGCTENATLPLDNTSAYMATSGAMFYLNPSLRANNRADREEIHNTAADATETTYAAEWTDFTFQDDAWATDQEGHKALVAMAGSSLKVSEFLPLAYSATGSQTIEFMYKVSNAADYTKPIFSIMSTDEYDEEESRGIILFPTKLMVLSSQERSQIYQKLDLTEDRIIHVAVVIQRGFTTREGQRNLCRIFINGRENAAFEFKGTSSFIDGENSCLRMGQQSTDTYLYMMRCYNRALGGSDIMNNYLNALIETAEVSKAGKKSDNNILDSGNIDYDLVKRAGFNCMVIETDDGVELPSLSNPNTEGLRVSMRFEYNDNPEWNVNIYNVPIDGQGTTSMKYAKWNLRNKISDSDTIWEYPNLRDEQGGVLRETGKEGYIAGYGLHPKVSKITSKKNVASSPQGHKMGATAFYHDLFVMSEGTDMLPNPNCRVATYQNPFMGFQKFANGTYKFIGLYTSGPDKTDKKTFGYNETTTFPNLMMIEGPNHAPYMTRFLVPWTEDVFYDYANETLSTGDSALKQEGWDADIAADFKTDKQNDQQNVMNLFTSEFKPAYDAIYYTSPYIAPLSATGKTLNEINANVTLFQSQKTNGYRNELMTFYDSEYRLIYFRYKTQSYEVLPLETHNMLQYLGLTGNPTLEQIIAAREAKFAADVFRYVNKQEALYHECFCELLGVSDNHAKNTYWRKFKSTSDNGRWGFNQDDLDTLFQNDNNGQDTKEYWVEPDDVNESSGAEIFQGANSAFWTQLRKCCQNELRDKMLLIVQNCVTLAARYNCSAPTVHQSVLNVIGHYFWSKSSKYFPAMAYNEDTLFAYINVWAMSPDASYNSVRPLTQVHGDHYETERAWVERRLAYIFSKYRIAGFKAQDGDGYGTLEFTPAESFDLTVTPAIDLYPRFSVGGAETSVTERTKAGDDCTLTLPGSSDTTLYIKGVDWLLDIGDLHNLKLASRGGSEEINFTVSGSRLRQVVIGSEDEPVTFNATTLGISGASIEEIHAQNVSKARGSLELFDCTRLKKAYFNGTNLSQIMFPIGGRLKEIKLPATIKTLFLHSLNLLTNAGLEIPDEAYANIENLYMNQCNRLNPAALLFRILSDENNLKFVTMLWDERFTLENADQLEGLAQFVNRLYDSATGEGIGALGFENGQLTTIGRTPDIQGRVYVPFPVYKDSMDAITSRLPNLSIDYDPDKLAIRFQDEEFGRIMLENYDSDHDGMLTMEEVRNVTSIPVLTNNTQIRSLNDLQYFTGLTQLSDCKNMTNLEDVVIPEGVRNLVAYAFMGAINLRSVTLPTTLRTTGHEIFNLTGAYAGRMEKVIIKDLYSYFLLQWNESSSGTCNPVAYTHKLWLNDEVLDDIVVPSGITNIYPNAFEGMHLNSLTVSEGVENLWANSFRSSRIETLILPQSLRTIQGRAFVNSEIKNFEYTLPNLVSVDSSAFSECRQLQRFILTALSLTSFALNKSFRNDNSLASWTLTAPNFHATGAVNSMFANCASLREVNLNFDISGITNISYMFNACRALESLSPETWNKLRTITRIDVIWGLFYGCSALTTVDVANWKVANCTDFSAVFQGCSALTSIDLSTWNMQNATTLSSMFSACNSLTTLNLPTCNMNQITGNGLTGVFYQCYNLENLDLSHFNPTGIISLHAMFRECYNLRSLNISNWDVSQVTNMDDTFRNCGSITNLDLSGWHTDSLTILIDTFHGMGKLETLDVRNFNTAGITSTSNSHYVFNGCNSLRYITLGAGWFASPTPGDITAFTCSSILGLDDEGNDNGWLAHVTEVIPAITTTKTISFHANLKSKTWAQPYLQQIAAKGWTVA